MRSKFRAKLVLTRDDNKLANVPFSRFAPDNSSVFFIFATYFDRQEQIWAEEIIDNKMMHMCVTKET